MSVSLIVAMSETGVIGHRGGLPWQLSSDLRRFKRLTMGHHIVMGRKTYESIGRLLPGRASVIITRQTDYDVPGAVIAPSLDLALEACRNDDQTFVIGGGQIYELALPRADRILLTLVHGQVQGDTYFRFDPRHWRMIEESCHAADEKNSHDHTFRVLDRLSVEV